MRKIRFFFGNKYGISIGDECISFLINSSERKEEWVKIKDQIVKDLIHYQITEKTWEFYSLHREHIKEHRQCLERFSNGYKKGKGKNLLYVLQMMGATEDILITQHYFHDVESGRGINCLVAPSHVHYLCGQKGPETTIFLYIGINLVSWAEFQNRLSRHRPATDRIYLFTLDFENSQFEISNCTKYRIQLVTTNSKKNIGFAEEKRVITVEEFLKRCKLKNNSGKPHQFSNEEKVRLDDLFEYKINYFDEYPLLRNFYRKGRDELLNNSEYKTIGEIIGGE